MIALRAPDLLGRYLALGCTLLICLEAVLNMGVVMGIFPTKGLPLPFVS
jgi:cell division protein FtsW